MRHPHEKPDKRKAMQAGTLVRITRTKAPCGFAVDCAIEGVLLTDVEAGKPVYLATMERNGDLVDGVFASPPVASAASDGFSVAETTYCVEALGEPGDFSLLAEVLLREMKPYEVQPM
jgi:hypothetical protein